MKVHFLGIGGSGASSAAALAQAQGFEVTGCDLDIDNEFTVIFTKNQLFKKHSPKHLDGVDILVVTPAIFSLDPNNPELKAAKLIYTWQQFVGKYLAKDKFVIAVCGTHGKTTTTAMIAQILEDAGLDPTVELGGIIPRWKTNFRIGKSKYMVVEADEFNDNFLSHFPQITVVTNIEMDHPEYFKDFEAVKRSFAKFVSQSKKVFEKVDPNLINFKLNVPGEFNVTNASLAFQAGLALGIKPSIIRKSLEAYSGVGRRFEYLGEFNKAKIYSDFGHHPTEIKVTMGAARQKFPNQRILLVYQPHMFSRTKFLFKDFVKVFQNLAVDKTFIVDIYPSREKDTGLVNSKQLVDAIKKSSVEYIGSISKTLEKIKPEIKAGDIVFFMGAGSIDEIARKLVKQKVLVFGLGLNQGGVGVAQFFAKNGAEVRVTDLKSKEALQPSLNQLKEFKHITFTLGEHRFEDIDWADLIIKNPAVKPGNKYIESALGKGKEVEMEMGIFLKYVKPQQIIGITGTKGKSTTASLIYQVLKDAGKNVVLAGNIGKSVLEIIPQIKPDTLVVLEISSFQLESFDAHQVSPRWAVITNIHQDHLNYYQTMDQYIQAKKIIAKYQDIMDDLFLKKGDPITSDKVFLKGIKSQIHYFSPTDLPENFHPSLPGKHNLNNIAAALKVTNMFELGKATILKTLASFTGLQFRLELVYEKNGLRIYNDTAATSPAAGIQAIRTFPNSILICGGMNKGMDYTEYAEEIAKNIKQVFFLEGDSTEEIIRKIQNSKFKIQNKGIYNNIEKILVDIKKIVKPGDIILFSPAATSFNLFQNEFDRGRKFNQAVEKVFQ